MTTAVITVGPRFKEPFAITVDWDEDDNRPGHILEDSGEPVARQAGNFIEYVQALGLQKRDPVLYIPKLNPGPEKDLVEVEASDWARIVNCALKVKTQIVRR